MNWNPLFDRVLIESVSSEETVSGLYIPDSSTNLKTGIVIAAGPGKKGEPMTVKEGDFVKFKKEDGTPITLDGKQYLIFLERDILMNK
jgi:chaperonin GroES